MMWKWGEEGVWLGVWEGYVGMGVGVCVRGVCGCGGRSVWVWVCVCVGRWVCVWKGCVSFN